MNRTPDVTGHLKAAARIQRLTWLYALLNDIKTTVVQCGTSEALLATMFGRIARSGLFPVIFVARTDEDEPLMHLSHSQGIPLEHNHVLETLLNDRDSLLRRALDSLEAGKTSRAPLPEILEDQPLIQMLTGQDLHDLLLMPLHAEGRLLGVVGLGTPGPDTFDQDHLEVMDYISTDICIALDNVMAAKRRHAAEVAARTSEQRFREVFESSPLPMLIYSTSARRLLSINRSMQNWLGYAVDDIADDQEWLMRFFPDEAVRRAVCHLWKLDLSIESGGDVITSSELTLTAKDGSRRTATGTMTRTGDEVIIAWNDLTEIRRKERASVESEALFRKMIEQSAVGIYVRRSGHFIYANARYCEIIGYSKDEIDGLDIHKVTTPDPENLQRIHEAWRKLEAGDPTVTYRVPLIRKDGVIIELELHARRIDWDGQPADIVIVDDITERKQQEDRIAGYVRQLESSMKSTLQAIAHMVEMRDPYTAGHERRTGIIASAIARELGWSAERCGTIEMIGLVHDIGKIAVPAEILTKPGSLTPLEVQMVHEHARAGYDILKDIPFPTPIATIILQHHEHLDGSGYPAGLKGDAILPEARVLAVADVLESMASHRPYRPALGVEAAISELKKHRGTLFDPEAVDALVRLIEQKNYTIPD